MSIVGPFGTYADMSPLDRTIYWFVAMLGVGLLMQELMLRALSAERFAALPGPALIATAAGLVGLPGACIVFLLETRLRGSDTSTEGFFWIWFFVTVIGFCIGLVQFRGLVFSWPSRNNVVSKLSSDCTDLLSAPDFVDRLPPELAGRLVSLTMQDHYLLVTTTAGTGLIHMRFSDALTALEGYPGARIHRSHWVEADAVAQLVRRNGRVSVLLRDGRSLPVSRSYLPVAKAMFERRQPDQIRD